MQEYEDPKIEKRAGSLSDSIETHPAYGQILANHVSGSTWLYGSDFRHNNYMHITIFKSELHRGLSNDRHYGIKELIEVSLSEAQWAAFLSRPNHGCGTPCTLNHIQGEMVPQIPFINNRKVQYKNEAIDAVKEAQKSLKELKEMVANLKVSGKQREELRKKVEMAERDVASSVDFVAEEFGEFIEVQVERGKMEIEAYAAHVINRTGLEVLGGTPPLEIANG